MSSRFSTSTVATIAKLAHIPVSSQEATTLSDGFTKTLAVLDKLTSVHTKNSEPHHTTGLENVFREDVVETSRMLTQEQALQNAPHTAKGFFVVDQVISQE